VHAPAKKKAAELSDLDLTVAYRFARQAPGSPPDLGQPSLVPPRSAQILAPHIFLDEFLYFYFTSSFKNS
jgi:hypothetical protein